MKLLSGLEIINYGLVLVYGLFLSVFIAGGWRSEKQKWGIIALCPAFILIQVPFWLLLGAHRVRQLYPLIVHLPLVLILILALKKPVGLSVVSVLTAYQCCQIPRWIKIAAEALTRSELVGEIAYTVCIGPVFLLMLFSFVKPAHNSISGSRQSLILFGSLPAVYYVFDYATTIYSDFLYAGIPALNELIPTALILFYVIFLTVYHHESQKRIRAELEVSARDMLLTQARKEMEVLREIQTRTTIYRHDMRHHLSMVDGFLAAGKPEQAMAYIRQTQDHIASAMPRRFCGNETVDLICSAYTDRAAARGIRLEVRAKLPEKLDISDTELCAVLSNALENALNAAARMPEPQRWIRLYCETKRNNLLIEVKNPYAGVIRMEDGLPVAEGPGHGLGCRSIRAIVDQHRGLHTFSPEDGIFTLQVVLPVVP